MILMPGAQPDPETVRELLDRAAGLAREYYALTGRPLGITGEVAEAEAARHLGLAIAPPRQEGYDATRQTDRQEQKVQIKGRWFPPPEPGGRAKSIGSQKLSRIRSEHPWDAVVLVLLDEYFRAAAIYEADRGAIEKQLDRSPSKAHNRGGVVGR